MRREKYVDYRSEVQKRLDEIDEVVERANEQTDLVDQAFLMQLAVIKLSGFVESAVGRMITGFLEENTSHRVLSFSKRQVDRLGNLNPSKLEQVVGGFDPIWAQELRDFLDRDENRQSLGNLIGARHKVAHGGETRANAAILTEYRRVAHETVELLFGLFLPLAQSAK